MYVTQNELNELTSQIAIGCFGCSSDSASRHQEDTRPLKVNATIMDSYQKLH